MQFLLFKQKEAWSRKLSVLIFTQDGQAAAKLRIIIEFLMQLCWRTALSYCHNCNRMTFLSFIFSRKMIFCHCSLKVIVLLVTVKKREELSPGPLGGNKSCSLSEQISLTSPSCFSAVTLLLPLVTVLFSKQIITVRIRTTRSFPWGGSFCFCRAKQKKDKCDLWDEKLKN